MLSDSNRTSATPLLAIHSSGLSGAQWTKFASALSPDFRVQTPDLLGYGADPVPFHEPFDFGQDLERMRSFLVEPSVLVGHSYGGFLALHLALRAPSLVKALVLFDPIAWGALRSSGDSSLSQLTEPRFMDPDSGREQWVESFVDFWGEPGSWAKISARAQQSMLTSYPKMRQEVEALISDRTAHTVYAAINCPTLLIGGARSPKPQRDVMAILHQAISGSRLRWMEGGHMAPLSSPAEFETMAKEFLLAVA